MPAPSAWRAIRPDIRTELQDFYDKELSVNIESVLLSDGKVPGHCLRSYLTRKLAAIAGGISFAKRQKGTLAALDSLVRIMQLLC